jgi:tetraacyldisaccharide 4'-kinase
MEFRVLTRALNLFPYQDLFFTTLEYEQLVPLFPNEASTIATAEKPLSVIPAETSVLLLTGIASPQQMMDDLQPHCKSITPLTFGDHHYFKSKDIGRINEAFEALPEPRMIITTEKDAARLYEVEGLSDDVRKNIYALPIRIKFMLDQEENFNHKILSYVQKNSRNSILVKTKDDIKPKDSNHSGERPRRISFRDN